MTTRKRCAPTAAVPRRYLPAIREVAQAIRAHLAAQSADHAPMGTLVAKLGTNVTTIKGAVASQPDLGLAGPRECPVVYSIHPAALAAGFRPMHSKGRMMLRLNDSGGPPWPLTISGAHLGTGGTPAAQDPASEECLAGFGRGELGYAITRLTLMARRWLITAHQSGQHDLTLRLFELIARAWRASSAPAWHCGRLHVHQVELRLPVGTRFWDGDTPTSRLELVVWAGKEYGFQLVNVYPAGTYRSIFGTEQP